MMSVSLTASLPEGVRLHLEGTLDEGFDYPRLAQQLRGVTVIDLEGVRRVTSFGVAQWQAALGETGGTKLSFIHCPPCMMTQFNIIRQFDCGGTLVSVYLPYLCGHCGNEHRVLYDRRGKKEFTLDAVAETVTCPQCGRRAEFDDVPEVYFEYLLHASPVSATPVLDQLIDAKAPPER